MAELITQKTGASVKDFILSQTDESRIKDCQTLLKLLENVTGKKGKMWGTGIIGFGDYHYKYATSREGRGGLVYHGILPTQSKPDFIYYVWVKRFPTLLEKLGKHKLGSGCLYIKKLADVNLEVLEEILKESVTVFRKGDFMHGG
ncbi:MAG: DUF1801 domain-containing protein [Bacteroidetes bacterium]|nr:DUF1801 domain-containing protein [Bacteroidota bacterium]